MKQGGVKPLPAKDYTGLVGGALTTVGLFAQVFQIATTHDTSGVSPVFFGLFTVGTFLWLYYGLKRQDVALIVWDSIGILLCAAVLALTIYYR